RFLPIYNNIIDSIHKMRVKIQSKIIYENENRTRMTDIPFIWMNIVQRYQIVNSWNKLKDFILRGYRDLYPYYLKQVEGSKTSTDSAKNASMNADPNSKSDSLKPNMQLALTNVCSVCFNWETDTLKPFVECVRCGMVSHVGCYGVNIPLNELLDFYGWLCDRCEQEKKQLGTQYLVAFNPGSVTCMLCSHSGGAFKRTSVEGEWVHLVCAIWHLPLVVCEDWKNLSNWNLERLRRSWTNKKSLKQNRKKLVLSYLGSNYSEKKQNGSAAATGIGGGGTATAAGGGCCVSSGSDSSHCRLNCEGDKKTKDVSQTADSLENQKKSGNNTSFGEREAEKSEDTFSSAKDKDGERELVSEDEEPYDSCVYCKNNNTLGLVSCCHSNCSKVYHPVCGWLNGIFVDVDEEPDRLRGEKLVEYIQGWRNVQDEALRMVSIRSYCRDHREELKTALDDQTIGQMTKEAVMGEEIGLRERRYINRDMFPEIFNSNSLTVDKYDKDVCSICLKNDPSDYPPTTLFNSSDGAKEGNIVAESFDPGLMSCRCCGLTVHWSCYGVPEGLERFEDFLCQTCQVGVRPERVSCVLCPRMGGAL
ncbi:hypothetical protein FG386_000263, partial [Cryptosporidium ryanae]|uniref:uncharacterized protein n=1 Tax=Cryptosporidium ryanae TaxID=515981 RepID=UPI00351A6B71